MEKRKVGRPKGSKNKEGVKTGRPKGSTIKKTEEIRKNSFSVKISDLELEKVELLRAKDDFKDLNNRAFFMKLIVDKLNS